MMLKAKTSKESLNKLRSSLLNGSEIRLIYAKETCCGKNCMQNMIAGSSKKVRSCEVRSGQVITLTQARKEAHMMIIMVKVTVKATITQHRMPKSTAKKYCQSSIPNSYGKKTNSKTLA